MPSTEQMVDLGAVMMRYMNMSEAAVTGCFAHGQVFLDGKCVPLDMRRIPYEPVRGQLLTCAGRQVTLGTRPATPPASLW
jgi:hypothetical protein